MKVKILKDCKYSSNGTNCINLAAGDIVDDLPCNVESAWLERGLCEADKPKAEPKKETKVVNPVVETKAKKKTTKAKK